MLRDPATGTSPVELVLTNAGDEIFRLPDPIEPDDLVVRWHDDSGRLALQTTTRALLPMALAPGASFPIELEVAAPSAPGRYAVDGGR